MPRKFLVGMSYVLANYVSELVGGLLGLIPTNYQLNNTLCSVGSNQKAIGIMQQDFREDFELEFVRGKITPNFLIYFYKSFLKPF